MKASCSSLAALWRDWVALASLPALAAIFLHKIVLGNQILANLDVFTYFYPYKAYVAEAIRSGSVPLWNPYLFMGAPLLANIQSAVLYPPSLPLYWLSVPRMVSVSIVAHLVLAAVFSYGYARRVLRFGPWPALMSALVLAFSGFLGAQAGHVNQLCVLAWLPLLFWLFFLSVTTRRPIYALLTSVVVAVQFLGGHTQSSYINLFALGCYSVCLPLTHQGGGLAQLRTLRELGRSWGRSLTVLAVVVSLGTALAAVQLVPTLELSRLSIRSAGLPYHQAVSFSLDPARLHRSLLPNLAESPFSEYVAYLGMLPLLLALVGVWRRGRDGHPRFFLALALLGLFLALGMYNPLYYLLYRLVPGFGLFRVPARWLYLYAVGMAFLAGYGLQELTVLSSEFRRPSRRWSAAGLSLLALAVVLCALDRPSPQVTLYWVAGIGLGGTLLWLGLRCQRSRACFALIILPVAFELFLCSHFQPYNEVTAPQAFSSLRTSTGNLLTDPDTYRLLSFSEGSFDPGDLPDIQRLFGDQLPKEAVYNYVVATKQKEILSPNLPLLYRLQSIDGYDGGVLPLARYVAWQSLLLPEAERSVDGRLQGRITEIPSGRLLNMLNIKYVLTDKTYDVWVDGAYYDLGHRAILGGEGPSELALADLPSFPTTAVGLVSYLEGGGSLPQGAPVAQLTFVDMEGGETTFLVRAGEDTAEGEYSAAGPLHSQARVVGHWRGNPAGNDYYALLDLGSARHLKEIRVRWVADQGQLRLRGMTLLDQRTGTHRALIVSTEGNYRLVHSGDVKIYENLDVLPRAYIVHQARSLDSDNDVLAALSSEEFDPTSEVLLSGEEASAEPYGADCVGQVRLISYAPERVTAEAETTCPGYLVLSDAHYPGWVALVDGKPEGIRRANFYFRAVLVQPGRHVIEFVYRPASVRGGLALSLAAGLAVSGAFVWERQRRRAPGD